MSGTVPSVRLGLHGLVAYLMKKGGDKQRQKVEASIATMPTSSLKAKPNIIYPVSQLRSIMFNTRNFGTLITPNIILETSNGSKQKFGIQMPDFEKAQPQLQQMYPTLCR